MVILENAIENHDANVVLKTIHTLSIKWHTKTILSGIISIVVYLWNVFLKCLVSLPMMIRWDILFRAWIRWIGMMFLFHHWWLSIVPKRNIDGRNMLWVGNHATQINNVWKLFERSKSNFPLLFWEILLDDHNNLWRFCLAGTSEHAVQFSF